MATKYIPNYVGDTEKNNYAKVQTIKNRDTCTIGHIILLTLSFKTD